MFQKFFESTIECKFIKSLLYNTNLPLLNTITEGDLMIKDVMYIYKTDIIKCTKTGYLRNTLLRCAPTVLCHYEDVEEKVHTQKGSDGCSEQYVCTDKDCKQEHSIRRRPIKLLCGSRGEEYSTGKYDIVKPYDFGRYYPQYTQRYIPKNGYYDNETHKFLGNYLRCYRDLYDVDLMPFYNCYNYEAFTDFHLVKTGTGWVPRENTAVKVLSVPIKFNKTYTIALDSTSEVLCKPVFHGPFGMLKDKDAEDRYITDTINDEALSLNYSLIDLFGTKKYTEINEKGEEVPKKYIEILKDPMLTISTNTSFKKPFTFRINNNKFKYQQLEKYLYLAIQVPANNNSSVVVLEGNYLRRGKETMDYQSVKELTDQEINASFTSSLSLLQINTNKIYAFSNRLIEYLLLNVITNRDEIRNNIGRVQDKIDYNTNQSSGINLKDIWDNGLRYKLYNNYMDDPTTKKLDILGFVDKDMERYLDQLTKKYKNSGDISDSK